MNPLLNQKGNQLPLFKDILPSHVVPAIETLIHKNHEVVRLRLEDPSPYTWDNLVWPIEKRECELDDVWATVTHLNAVMNSAELHEVYENALLKLSLYHTEMKQNEKLYQAFLSVQKSDGYKDLNAPQKKVIENYIKSFKLSGVTLSPEKREEFKALSILLSELESQFEQNVLESTNAWFWHLPDETMLRGLPLHALESAKKEAENRGLSGCVLTLDQPSYQAVMGYAENREIREKLYKAYTTRSSKDAFFPEKPESIDVKKWDNGPLMVQILEARHKKSNLLDFKNYAEYKLQTRMLKNTDQVIGFLADLNELARQKGIKEFEALKEYAKNELQITDLQVWDVPFVSERILEKEYAVSEAIIRQYFPEESALAGVFTVLNRLYGIEIKEIAADYKWHETVRLFEVFDENKNLRGKFFVDLYTRPNKQGGAWVADCKTRMQLDDNEAQTPVAHVVANFTKPVEGVALLTHDELITLFHEFGHCIHEILTKVDYPSISGMHGVSWDAVELPSQLLENWCWEKDAIHLISGHYLTHECLPEALIDKMKAAKNFNGGLMLLRQLEFAQFDFAVHMQQTEQNESIIQTRLNEIRQKTTLLPVPPYNRFQNSFTHIFSGGYSAGYYSYLWAESMAFDAYAYFKSNAQVFDKTIAHQFLTAILEKGGSKEFMELFIDFRGRPPEIDAFLKALGLS